MQDRTITKAMRKGTRQALLILLLLAGTPGVRSSVDYKTNFQTPVTWPEKYAYSYGFELLRDHDGRLIIWSVDSTSQAFRLGVRPNMDLIGWNTLPVDKALASIKVRKYRKLLPTHTDEQIRMTLLSRGHCGEQAEVFLMTETGNNRGIRVQAGLSR
jgi:hypothetical protein